MYKELRENTIKTVEEIGNEYPYLAYIMLNPETPRVNGILELPRGTLFAVADSNGLDELSQAVQHLRSQGVNVLVDPNEVGMESYDGSIGFVETC